MTESVTETIYVEQFIGHPPATVWAALTEPERLAQWWVSGDIRPVVGHRFELPMGEWGKAVCTVLAVEDGRMIRYTFGEGDLDTVIEWRVEPEGTGTRLFLEHSGFDMDSPADRTAFDGMGSGWSSFIVPGLATYLDTVAAT